MTSPSWVLTGPYRNLQTKLLMSTNENPSGIAIVEHLLEPGSFGEAPHLHTREDEISIILEGEITIWEEGRISIYKAGEVALKKRNSFHAFWNGGSQPLRFIDLYMPGNFASYFYEISHLLPLPGKACRKQMDLLNKKYGLQVDDTAMGTPFLGREPSRQCSVENSSSVKEKADLPA
ncbi:cupin domain-containing protein [Rhodocytophaga rosea]|uniref:Cupin domain-containing protein n=1 Tax=Rhodocytophaga rosea TaxID=2704465 RepID=A0A6C0GHQ8_9BACT|nr:cupin domain-containing protein [Rhodocytophaga rosea]QHT67354.1 cupin domain-containing protein [Rhodocytophaga rosea]